jgi:outer membrane receptor protein involved in Fe transport
VPATVTVLPRAEIERSPTKTTDELLRIVPSFGLFRRTSSVVSDPTAQGLNLRGVGPSGVSRSLVLVDGIPANDPFGGWVYWRAIPRLGIRQVEVVPGGGSAQYGTYALGGVIQVLTRPITPDTFDANAEVGSRDTAILAARAADRWGPVGAVVEGEFFNTDGYPVVADYARGAVDRAAPSDHFTVNGRVEVVATPALSLFASGGYFNEDQNGGTQFTTAEVRVGYYAAGGRLAAGAVGAFDLTVFGHEQTFEQARARIFNNRNSEALFATQDVPTNDQGLALLWTSRPLPFLGTHVLTAGTDLRRIEGDVREDLFPSPLTAIDVVRRDAGGTQRLAGVFLQEVYEPSRAVEFLGAVRFDYWENIDASRFLRFGDGTISTTQFNDRSDHQVSPKVGVRVRPINWLTLRASAYQAFRAPTLNELYRPFQVGTGPRTAANENLGPETLRGAEAGFEVVTPVGLTTRVTGFWNELDDPITNVTLATPLPPDGSTRQRQNLGEARVQGFEVEAGWRLARVWFATAAYTFVDSEVTRAPAQPQLVGKQLAQDPKHRANVSLSFDDPRLVTATVQVRYVGSQFEDDQNTRRMGGFVVVDLSASRRLRRNVDVFVAAENLFDKQYLVGRGLGPTGVDTIGQPLFIHGGVRVRFGG